MSTEVSDEILNAYIDNELDAAERADLLDRMVVDTALCGRACELWQTKQMVRGAYPLARQAMRPQRTAFSLPRWTQALAATVLLTCGALSGWFVHGRVEAEEQFVQQIEAIRADGGRVVLHLFSDEPARIEAALRKAEQLASARDRAGRPFRVEFLANGPGLHLLRTGGSAYAPQIEALRAHENLRLIACREAMDRLRDRGIDVSLLPGVEEAPSAEGELAARLTQGWRYVQT